MPKKHTGTLQENGLKKCCRIDCNNPKTRKDGFLPKEEFSKNKNFKDGLTIQCQTCKKKDNKKSVLRYTKTGRELKLNAIKAQNCLCPACGFDFSMCPDTALMIIFELSHVHGSNCKHRKRKGTNNYCFSLIDDYSWACLPCNRKQKGVCGYWQAPGIFLKTC